MITKHLTLHLQKPEVLFHIDLIEYSHYNGMIHNKHIIIDTADLTLQAHLNSSLSVIE